MRNFFILLFLCISGFAIGQKNTNLALAVDHIRSQAQVWNLKPVDYKDLLISSEVTTAKGITYLYLNQSYNNLPIRNAMITLIIKDGKVVSDQHNFVTNIESRIENKSEKIRPQDAIMNSAAYFGIMPKSEPKLSTRSENGKFSFEFSELTKSPIPAELKYELVGEKLVLVWNLNLDMKNSADYWDINIDANSGDYVSKHNYTTYCQHQHDAFTNHDRCNIRTFRKINENTKSVNEALSSNKAAARYNVFSLPAESPNHGERKIVTDDQFPTASPFGWHDTNGAEGAEYTITRGNNVYAYQDKNDDDDSDGPDTNGGDDLNFDFPMDLTNDPRESADAAVTNLFYMVNMMHDVAAMVGFTEEFGNFQQKNYTNKGDDGDYVLAQAFDGITLHEAGQDIVDGNPTKINNANFSTPPDGFNGRMQMFFWNNSGGAISIDSPESIKGFLTYGEAGFGRPIPNDSEDPVTGKVVLVNDGSINSLIGCNPLVNGAAVNGNIALIERGVCQFSRKVYRAQQSGAIAAIICNIAGIDGGDGESAPGMASGTDGGLVTIPSISLKKSDCEKIKFVIANGGEVIITFKERSNKVKYLDGALDNGIIAHEFGHGISTRLTGGRSNSSCLNNDEQMGEGWSDFFSLIMTHELGDKSADVRGIGTYAVAQSVEGRGIRRFPYSTDMNINPQTYDNIKGTTAPHPLGEIWAGVLWDLYWAFIDQYGYNPDWSVETSGNYKAVYLVMEGMKMQTCNPGFIQGRDAIISADKLHFNNENNCLIWGVFARRGLGFYAVGGSTANRNDGVENFETLPTCIEALKITKTADVSINAGDEINITLRAINHIPSRQNNVIITDELPSGMTYVSGSSTLVEPVISGSMLTFELGDVEYDKEISFSYKTKSSVNNKSILLESENFDGDITWDFRTDVGSESWFTSYDIFRSPDLSYGIFNVAGESDASLLTIPYTISGSNPALRFWHRYNIEAGNDGGFLEISVNNGLFVPVKKSQFIRNGYNGPLSYSTLALPNLDAFSGTSGGNWSGTSIEGPWLESIIDLSEYKGQNITIKFRFGSNATVKGAGDFAGWFIDDFEILDLYKYSSEACIIADGGNGAKACTNPIETLVNSDGTVNTDDNKVEFFNVDLQPNPANDYIVISATAPINTFANVEILSAEGKSVYTTSMQLDRTIQYKSINTAGFPSGFYIIKIQNGNHITTRKLVIK
jgi:extracellular elastinolytic metalloproteinase